MVVPRSTTANSSPAQTGDELAVMSVLKVRAGFHSVARLASLPGPSGRAWAGRWYGFLFTDLSSFLGKKKKSKLIIVF